MKFAETSHGSLRLMSARQFLITQLPVCPIDTSLDVGRKLQGVNSVDLFPPLLPLLHPSSPLPEFRDAHPLKVVQS